MSPSVTVPVQTRFGDMDMNRHVNHVQYYAYMEVARVRFMEEHAGTLKGHVLVAHTECDHHREIPSSVREVMVTVYAERVGRTSVVIRHDLVAEGVEVATGRAIMVAVDRDRRPRPVTDDERASVLGTD
jgi:acyl-CoA thioester hydrolase